MTTRQQKHIPALDGLRGIAVLAVLFFHYGGGTQSHNAVLRFQAHVLKAGWAGVTLFFVLSGFLITGILWDSFGKPHWARNFYARRTLRILPLYYLSLLLVLIGAAWAGTLPAALRHIWIAALFLQNMPHLSGLSGGIASPIMIFHLWSLAVEEQFYLIWPFLLVLQRSRKNALYLCLGVFLLSAGFRILAWTTFSNPIDFWQFLLSRAGELSLGSALAILYRGSQWSAVQRWAPPVALASLAGFIASSIYSGTADLLNRAQFVVGLPCMALFCAALLALALHPGWLQRLLSARWLRWIGSLSYGIYIFHILLGKPFHALAAALVGSKGETAVNAAQLVIVLVGSIAVAWLSFTFFETPFLRLKRRYPSAPAT
ncbi:MAG: hypothetical protein NVSMB3_07660 [Acidobacteriaceae bacterium]